MTKMKRPRLKVSYSDRGKKLTFDPGFWDMPLEQPIIQQAVAPQIVQQPQPTIPNQNFGQQGVVTTQQEPIIFPQQSNRFRLPTLREMLGPQPLHEYMRDYFGQILGIPRLPALHEYLFADGKLPRLRKRKKNDKK